MRIQDSVGLVAILATVASGAFFIGQLAGEVNELRSQVEARGPLLEISEAKDAALAAVRSAGDSFLAFDSGDVADFGWNHGDSDVRMIPANEGICYISRFAGQFAGNGEWIEIVERDGYWYLRANSNINTPGGRLYARAKCWKFPTAEP